MRTLAPNSLILTISNILNAAAGFALSLVVGRGLGEPGFGVWVFCLTWASILTMICEFGLNSLLTREAARMPNKLNQLLLISLTIKLFLVLILAGGVWLCSPILALNVESSAALRVSMLIVFAGVSYGSFTAVFRSAGWMSPILWLNLWGGIIQLIWSGWILWAGGGILALIWAAFAVDIGQIFSAILLWQNRLRPGGGPLNFVMADLNRMARDTLPFALSAFLGALEARSNVLLLGYLSSGTEVGRFGMASRFFEAARVLPNGMYDAAFPAFAAQLSQGKNPREIFQSISRVILLYTLLVTISLIWFSRQIIDWTYGPLFLSATPTLSWLGVALLPTLHNAVIEVYLFATGDEKYATKLGLVGLTVQIVASIPLMHFFGALGAAFGVLIAELAIWLPLRLRMGRLLLRTHEFDDAI
jgi:O-antigen/teichoic acid export membrane protein